MQYRWLLVLPLVLTGCTPESIVWAPNGKTGLVSTQNATYLFDDKGKISEPLPGNPFGLTPGVWVPETNNFVLVRSQNLAKWNDVKEIISEEQRQRIESNAMALLHRLAEYSGELTEFTSNLQISRTELVAAWMYLRDEKGKELEQIVREKKNPDLAWSNISSMKTQGFSIDLYEGHGLLYKSIRTIHRSLDAVFSLRFSPDGKWLALVSEEGPAKMGDLSGALPLSTAGDSLSVMNLENGEIQITIDEKVGLWPAWSADGKNLFYFHVDAVPTVNHSTPVFGNLRQAKLSLRDIPTIESKEDILDVLFNPFDKITSMSSGDILIISQAMELPKQRSNEIPQGTIAIFNPKQPARIAKVDAPLTVEQRRALSQGGFSVSPDSTRIALTTSKGTTDIVDLNTGEVQNIAIAHSLDRPIPGHSKLPTNVCPVWRSDNELVFRSMVVSETHGLAEHQYILWSPEKSIILSKNWQLLKSEVASGR